MENTTEQITPHLIRYWLFDKRVVVYQPNGASRETVDAWHDLVVETADQWPTDRPYLEIHDMSNSTVTPYARQRAQELVEHLNHRRGRTAIILPSSQVGRQMMSLLINITFRRWNRTMERQVFTSLQRATAWVKEML